MADVCTIGSTGSHGGTVTTGGISKANGKPVARIGDTYQCPLHGKQTVTQGSPAFIDDGHLVAFVGCSTSCGATLTSGESCIQL